MKKLTHFVSEIDQFLAEFDRSHPNWSTAQKNEQEKYRLIYFLRDHVTSNPSALLALWKDF